MIGRILQGYWRSLLTVALVVAFGLGFWLSGVINKARANAELKAQNELLVAELKGMQKAGITATDLTAAMNNVVIEAGQGWDAEVKAALQRVQPIQPKLEKALTNVEQMPDPSGCLDQPRDIELCWNEADVFGLDRAMCSPAGSDSGGD